ncbi:MAG: hypothetical protein JXR78_18005 [Victivallales bacterium]|nr:hypothetical protein [Victivallales bacterium]
MSRFKIFIMYCVVVAISVILLIGVSVSSSNLNTLVKEHHLHATGQVSNAPPLVTFTTVALGSFRGILADLLWLRTIALQEEGNYFEMVQLASWITMLQPNFTGATAYLAWNMAYNISVTCSDFADRWKWIQRGIELIRDEALQYNKEDPLLYKELGWIYQHKIGNIMDDANLYYKNQIALQMMRVFNGAEPDWDIWSRTPQTYSEFTRTLSKEQLDALNKVLTESGYAPFYKLSDYFRKENKLPEAFTALYKNKLEQEQLETFLRVLWLVDVYKLNPVLMHELNLKYGKLDWRLPESMAIYWATMGLKMTPSGKDISCERMISQSLKDAFMGGRLLMVDAKNYETILTVPNFNVTDSVLRVYREAYERNQSSSFRSAMLNFMKDAVVIMYNFGKYTQANELYGQLRKEEPGHSDYRGSLDAFVMKEWIEDVRDANPKQANDIISGLIFRSINFLVFGDIDAAISYERRARMVYNLYMRENADVAGRTGLVPYNELKSSITKSCLENFPKPLADILRAQLEAQKAREKEKEAEIKAASKVQR